MLALYAAYLASTLAFQPAAVEPDSGRALYSVQINGSAAQVAGEARGGAVEWDDAAQQWYPCPPSLEPPPVGASLQRYTIGVNGASVVVNGWVDARGVFHWRWADQAGRRPGGSAQIEAGAAVANGVELRGYEATGGIRASDPDAAREIAEVMASSRSDPDEPEPDEAGGSGWTREQLVVWGAVATLASIISAATVGGVLYLFSTRRNRVV